MQHAIKTMKSYLAPALILCAACATTSPQVKLEPIDRSALPNASGTSSWNPPEVSVSTLKNGMRLWSIQRDAVPLVSIRMIFSGGSSHDPEGLGGTTSLMMDMLDEGAGDLDALALSDAFGYLATDYGVHTEIDGSVLSLNMLAEQVAPSLDLLKKVLREPHFSEKEFERIKSRRIAQALAQEAQPASAARAALYRAVFQDGYAAHPAGGTQSSLAKISLENLKAQYQTMLSPKNATIVVVGAIDSATISAELERVFADWSTEPSSPEETIVQETTAENPANQKVFWVEFKDAPQTVVYVARAAEGHEDPKYFENSIFNYAWGGSFTGRLNMNLREDKGYTYGARSGFSRFQKAGMFLARAEVKADTTLATIQEIQKEMTEALGERNLSAEEVQKARSGMVLKYPTRFETIDAIASELSQLALAKRELSWLSEWREKINGVSQAKAQDAAKDVLNPSDFTVLLAGDAKHAQAVAEHLKRPLVQLDAEGREVK